jgi:signal transduction histidine kinase
VVFCSTKFSFLVSISHELRSPLHGVLASVEFLQETSLTEVQQDLVDNINSSGKVLLDTINHVLDFSKVNKKVKSRGKVSKSRNGKQKRFSFPNESLGNTTDNSADICSLSENVLESVWAGRSLNNLSSIHHKSRPQSITSDSIVTTIVDVRWRPNWSFEIDPGAWIRIILNLFGNSMKYTKSGFIKISLTIEENKPFKGKKTRSLLVLKVADSGKGISQEFLRHHLYKPFTQEDSLAVRIPLTTYARTSCLARPFMLSYHMTMIKSRDMEYFSVPRSSEQYTNHTCHLGRSWTRSQHY